MNFFKATCIGIIAVAIVAIMLSFSIRSADASVWQNRDVYEDMDEVQFHLLQTRMGNDQFAVFACGKSDAGIIFYYQRMDFGDFVYIGSGGANMRVKYGKDRVKKEDGWSIIEGDGSIVDRTFFVATSFKKHVEKILSSGNVKYRVTSYNGSTFDIAFKSPSRQQVDHLYKNCGIN